MFTVGKLVTFPRLPPEHFPSGSDPLDGGSVAFTRLLECASSLDEVAFDPGELVCQFIGNADYQAVAHALGLNVNALAG
ncbi:MAG: hypothetical protein SNJ52_01585 [Verrucomicrobiia bacterium]